MKFNMDGLSNIHCAAPDVPAPAAPPTDHCVRYRQEARSPDEEFFYRVARDGAPIPLPNEVAAILLSARGKPRKVGTNGIDVTISGRPYRYWHPDSKVCLNPDHYGAVMFVMSQEHRDCIHLLDAKGRYVETLPLAAEPDWFSSEAHAEKKKTRAVADRIKKDLDIIHTQTKLDRGDQAKANREKLVSLHTFRPDAVVRTEAPAQTPTAERNAARHRVDFSAAADLADIIGETDRRRADHRAANSRARDRMRAAAGDVDDLLVRERRVEADQEESTADLSELL